MQPGYGDDAILPFPLSRAPFANSVTPGILTLGLKVRELPESRLLNDDCIVCINEKHVKCCIFHRSLQSIIYNGVIYNHRTMQYQTLQNHACHTVPHLLRSTILKHSLTSHIRSKLYALSFLKLTSATLHFELCCINFTATTTWRHWWYGMVWYTSTQILSLQRLYSKFADDPSCWAQRFSRTEPWLVQ